MYVAYYLQVEGNGQHHARADLPPGKKPRIHWIGGCVVPRTGVDDERRRKILTISGLELQTLCRLARS
jgi:hypothetical protein